MEYLQQAYFSNLNAICREGGFFGLQPGKSWKYEEHSAVFNKFYYVTGGGCQITIEGKHFRARAGDWFFIPADTKHSYTDLPGEPFEKYWIHFDLLPDASLSRLLQLPFAVRGDEETTRLFEQLTRANDANHLADKLHAKILLLQLITQYLEIARKDDLPVLAREEQGIDRVLGYIHSHLDQPLHNSLLAQQCHMHPNHFIRYFSKRIGQTPASYVVQCRMDMARQLLIKSDLTVNQIAERVGIPEQSHFARLFRRYYALTPTQYRKRHEEEMV